MNTSIFSRSAFGISAAILVLTGCGGGSSAVAPLLPVAAQFNFTVVNSVIQGSTQSSISFAVEDVTRNCIQFPGPFSDNHLDYGASTVRAVELVDCGTSGWFTVRFHALDVQLADTIVKWTVSEAGVTESTVTQGGLCVSQVNAPVLTEKITAKPASGCP